MLNHNPQHVINLDQLTLEGADQLARINYFFISHPPVMALSVLVLDDEVNREFTILSCWTTFVVVLTANLKFVYSGRLTVTNLNHLSLDQSRCITDHIMFTGTVVAFNLDSADFAFVELILRP